MYIFYIDTGYIRELANKNTDAGLQKRVAIFSKNNHEYANTKVKFEINYVNWARA